MDQPVGAVKPGVERWSVKTGTDADAAKVGTVPQPATIASLAALLAPADPDAIPDRHLPTEVILYQVAATLAGFKEEQDGDYHLVLDDGQGHTMIAEIPDPAFCAGSAWLPQITAARQAFDGRFGVQLVAAKALPPAPDGSVMMTKVSVPVTVTGVGFFDRLHGQTGVAPNGIELHPVLALLFADGPLGRLRR